MKLLLLLCLHCLSGAIVRGQFHHSLCGGSEVFELFLSCCSCVLRWLCSVFFVFLQVAVQLALLISKIARFDYPREWYVLFHLLNPGVPLFVNLILICVIEIHVRVMEHILSLTFKSLVMPF